ncbi:MAG: hypothetical protein R6W97_00705 [Thiobacillus sp.]
MKRKVAMLGLAMLTGLPQVVCAKGQAKSIPASAFSSWNAPYMPHFGSQGAAQPLMDHLAAPATLRRGGNTWQMDFAPPPPVSAADDPLSANDKRMGVRFKLDF